MKGRVRRDSRATRFARARFVTYFFAFPPSRLFVGFARCATSFVDSFVHRFVRSRFARAVVDAPLTRANDVDRATGVIGDARARARVKIARVGFVPTRDARRAHGRWMSIARGR